MKKLMKALIEAKLKDAPQSVKSMHLKNLERMDFSSEDEFITYLGEIDPESKAHSFQAPDDDKVKSIVNALMR